MIVLFTKTGSDLFPPELFPRQLTEQELIAQQCAAAIRVRRKRKTLRGPRGYVRRFLRARRKRGVPQPGANMLRNA